MLLFTPQSTESHPALQQEAYPYTKDRDMNFVYVQWSLAYRKKKKRAATVQAATLRKSSEIIRVDEVRVQGSIDS